jgi:hypothetical protein
VGYKYTYKGIAGIFSLTISLSGCLAIWTMPFISGTIEHQYFKLVICIITFIYFVAMTIMEYYLYKRFFKLSKRTGD